VPQRLRLKDVGLRSSTPLMRKEALCPVPVKVLETF
jgi:hypothetical protein